LSGPIPEEILTEILSRANIVDIVGEHLPLRKVGSGYQGICPFHADSKPSFHVNEAKQFFYCFGCGAGGNAFHFLMRIKHLSFPEAVRELASRYGVSLPEKPLSPQERRRRRHRERLLQINNHALQFFLDSLAGPQGEEARRYLERRGISQEVQEAFSLGFAPEGWQSLVDYLKGNSLSLEDAEEAGLIVRRRGGGFYDRFRGRLIFPIRDEGGRVIGFGGRTLGNGSPKYLNSPETPLFSKRRNLYGLHLARSAIREADAVVVVEGYTDLLALHQFGVPNSVATLGTALTPEHVGVLKRLTENLVFLFDADEAGKRATVRALDLCTSMGVWGKVVALPEGHDPDTFVREVGGEALRRAVQGAVPLFEHWMEGILSGVDKDRAEDKVRAMEMILPYIRRLRNPVAQDHYIARLSESLHIKEGRIREMLRSAAPVEDLRSRDAEVPSDPHRAERLLLQAVFLQPELAARLESHVVEEFRDPSLRELAVLIRQWRESGQDSIEALESRVQDPDSAQRLAGLLAGLEAVSDPHRVFEDCLRHIRRRGLDRRIRHVDREILEAKVQKDETRLRELQQQKAHLVLQKARLRMSA